MPFVFILVWFSRKSQRTIEIIMTDTRRKSNIEASFFYIDLLMAFAYFPLLLLNKKERKKDATYTFK